MEGRALGRLDAVPLDALLSYVTGHRHLFPYSVASRYVGNRFKGHNRLKARVFVSELTQLVTINMSLFILGT
jgi:hypothetical protein